MKYDDKRMTDRILILFNPSAGKGRARLKLGRLEESLRRHDVPCELVVTRSEQELRTIVREQAGSRRTIAGAGGDSTFHIMANELIHAAAETRLGIIGIGSSNDIAREFGLDSLDRACAALKKGSSRKIDLGCIRQEGSTLRYFIGQANIGLGVVVNQRIEFLAGRSPHLARKQTLAGMMAVIGAFRLKKIPLSLRIESERGDVSGEFTAAVFSNIRFWATGRIIAPASCPDDGRLDACLIRSCSFGRLLTVAAKSRRGRHISLREVEIQSAPSFEVSSGTPFEVQTDGEILGGHQQPGLFTKLTFCAVSQSLNIIC